MTRYPQNGPTFSKPPPKKRKPKPVASPERRQAELDEKIRDAADTRLMHKDPAGWLKKHQR
jgi:hypothetical protein